MAYKAWSQSGLKGLWGVSQLFAAMFAVFFGVLSAGSADAQAGPYFSNNPGSYSTACTGPAAAGGLPGPGPAGGDLRVTIPVTDTFVIGDVDVGIVVDQAFRLDTSVFVTSPQGTRIQLLEGFAPNNQVDDYNVVFDQDASTEVNTGVDANRDHNSALTPFQFQGAQALRPEVGSLDSFDGEAANGNWFVDFCDNFDDGPNPVGRVELFFSDASSADLSLALSPSSTTPTSSANTFIDVAVVNSGPLSATNVTVDFPLPSGLSFVSSTGTGSYSAGSGNWTIGSVASGATATLRVIATVESTGSYALSAEVQTSDQSDPDSTPGNSGSFPLEDDTDSVTLVPQAPPAPLFCLGRPIQPLVFQSPIADSPGSSLANPQVGDVFRFVEVSPGIDALVEVTSFNGTGAGLVSVDDDGQGQIENFQPTLAAGAGDVSVDLEIRLVTTGTSTPQTLDFAGSTVDVDGGAGIREYVEVSNNIVELAVNGQSPPTPATRIISQFIDPNPTGVPQPPSAPSSPARVRFEVDSETQAPNGAISLDAAHIATAFFTDVSVFEYRIGKFGNALGGAGRLNSLAFNCPTITPTTTNPVLVEDFGDAPASFGNPIHVIQAGIQLGATNTDETGPGDSPTASSDSGDDGITLPAAFDGLSTSSVTANVSGSGGRLQAFFDWNADGDFDDADERPIFDLEDNAAGDTDNTVGVITFDVTAPLTTADGTSFARFRWATSSVGLIDPAGDGEVEDYQINLNAAPVADLSLALTTPNTAPTAGNQIDITLTITNDGPQAVSGVTALYPLPSGLSFVSDLDGGGSYDENTGVLTVPGTLVVGASFTVVITVDVEFSGVYSSSAEVTASGLPDPDSTPNNASTIPAEDDSATLIITPFIPPQPTCPAGTQLLNQTGNAFDVVDALTNSVANSDRALGPLAAENTSPPDAASAEMNANGDTFVLDLGVVVPENGTIVFSLGRDGGGAGNNTRVQIQMGADSSILSNVAIYGATPADFVSAAQDVLERISVTVPAGGAQFIGFDTLNGDDLFIDGVEYTQICNPAAELQAVKTITVFDPAGSGSTDVFAIPGNDVRYTITVSNSGGTSVDANTILLIDELPTEIVFFNGDADGPGPGSDPVIFEEIEATGLSLPFSFTNDVGFSDSATRPTTFAECTYSPSVPFGSPDPSVRFVCINPKGSLGFSSGGAPDPSFAISFRARIR